MNFGVREVCDLVFTKQSGIGPTIFKIETAKMSTIESASTTVYAQGGRGNSRLRTWEGEKTLTFTVEDALITLESFYALTGATVAAGSNNGVKFNVYPNSFAGTYSINATTLFRDEKGIDHDATIYIPNAKLQTTLNLSMAPTGDPSTFTFTFDAMPSAVSSDNKLLFSLDINGADGADTMVIPSAGTTTYVVLDGETYSITGTSPKLKAVTGGAVTLEATGAQPVAITTLTTGQNLTDGASFFITMGEATEITLTQGSATRLVILA